MKKSIESVTLLAVGDICPGDKYIVGLGVLQATRKKGVDYLFDKVRDQLNGGDVVIGNLEGLLSAQVKRRTSIDPPFCGLPEFAPALARTGFNVINVANNHTLEHGPKLFLETIEILQKTGLKICGLRDRTNNYYSEPVILQIKGKKIGILGYNWVGVDQFPTADTYIAQCHDSVVNYTWDRDHKRNIEAQSANIHVKEDIKKLRAEVDIVILAAHWGFEFVSVPPYNLTLEAHALIDVGVDVIVGTHPHVLQGMEQYNKGIIFYSLGNFVFDSRGKMLRHTAILEVVINGDRSISHQYKPLFVNNSFQPQTPTCKQRRSVESLLVKSNECLASPNKQILTDDDMLYKKYVSHYNRLRYVSIFFHFLGIFRNPAVAVIVFHKVINFLKVMLARLKGQKVRW